MVVEAAGKVTIRLSLYFPIYEDVANKHGAEET